MLNAGVRKRVRQEPNDGVGAAFISRPVALTPRPIPRSFTVFHTGPILLSASAQQLPDSSSTRYDNIVMESFIFQYSHRLFDSKPLTRSASHARTLTTSHPDTLAF
jgi:hypothetical protein